MEQLGCKPQGHTVKAGCWCRLGRSSGAGSLFTGPSENTKARLMRAGEWGFTQTPRRRV